METDKEITDLFQKYKKLTKDAVSAAILTQTQIQNDVVIPPPSEISDDPEMMTVDEAARIIKCSTWTIYRAVDTGALKASRFGRNKRMIRIPRAAIDEYLEDKSPTNSRPKEKAIWR